MATMEKYWYRDLAERHESYARLLKINKRLDLIDQSIGSDESFSLNDVQFLAAYIDDLFNDIHETNLKLYQGTLHVGHCNADHRGPVGNDGCSCPLGRRIKTLEYELKELRAIQARNDRVDGKI